jgi:hypothetical protein
MNANTNNHVNGTKTSELSFDEAPASWNTRYLDPNGFECQITLRGESGSELLEKAASAIAYLLKNDCIPYVYRSNVGRKDSSTSEAQDAKNGDEKANGNGKNGGNPNPAWRPIHQCEMKRWDKDGRVWYSHKVDG